MANLFDRLEEISPMLQKAKIPMIYWLGKDIRKLGTMDPIEGRINYFHAASFISGRSVEFYFIEEYLPILKAWKVVRPFLEDVAKDEAFQLDFTPHASIVRHFCEECFLNDPQWDTALDSSYRRIWNDSVVFDFKEFKTELISFDRSIGSAGMRNDTVLWPLLYDRWLNLGYEKIIRQRFELYLYMRFEEFPPGFLEERAVRLGWKPDLYLKMDRKAMLADIRIYEAFLALLEIIHGRWESAYELCRRSPPVLRIHSNHAFFGLDRNYHKFHRLQMEGVELLTQLWTDKKLTRPQRDRLAKKTLDRLFKMLATGAGGFSGLYPYKLLYHMIEIALGQEGESVALMRQHTPNVARWVDELAATYPFR